jgi:uncharacterized membrane protein (DUF373 family)
MRQLREAFKDHNFLHFLDGMEGIVSKVLSLAMVLVIMVCVYDLSIFLIRDFVIPEMFSPDFGRFGVSLFKIFGLFLNVLIALEILENITAYLKKHVVQVELVIVTSLIAVARKIIILDLEQKTAMDLISLAVAIFALSGSYWLVRTTVHRQNPPPPAPPSE